MPAAEWTSPETCHLGLAVSVTEWQWRHRASVGLPSLRYVRCLRGSKRVASYWTAGGMLYALGSQPGSVVGTQTSLCRVAIPPTSPSPAAAVAAQRKFSRPHCLAHSEGL